jgi:hypothetical protein
LLYFFYLCAYKVNFSAHAVQDYYAPDSESFNPRLWLQDLIAPFIVYLKISYTNRVTTTTEGMEVSAKAEKTGLGKNKDVMSAKIYITQSGITSFEINTDQTKNTIKCNIKSI